MRIDGDGYRVLFELNPLPMFVSDRQTRRIIDVNRAACEHYGWTRDEFVTLTLADIRPPEEVAHFEAAYADPTKDRGTGYSRTGRHRTKDGRILDVTLQISTMMLGGTSVALAVVTDVTGVAQVERRFRLFVENSADGISVTSPGNVIEYVSPGGARMLGYEASELAGLSTRALAHPDDVPKWAPPQPGETRHQVSRMRHRDGSWRYIESSTTNLLHDPAVRAYVSNYRDITERKLAEDSLVESQRRLEFLLSATAAVTYTARASGDYGATFISTNVREVLGHDPADFVTDSGFWLANIHPDDRPAVLAKLESFGAAESLTLQYRFRHRDGSYRWMRDVNRIVRDSTGAPVEVVGYWIDASDQLAVESAMRRSEANFRAVIEHAPIAAFVHRDGHFVYMNPAAVRLLGVASADQVVGRAVLELIHPDDRKQIVERIERIRSGGSERSSGGRMIRGDGSTFALEGEAIRIDFDGEPSYLVMGYDVTERHEMFSRMALADRMLSVGTLAAGVAHEINNPLAYVAANLETLAAELPNVRLDHNSRLRDASLRALVSDAREGVTRMSAIVQDLRSLSRHGDETSAPFDVGRVLASSIKMAHNEIRHRARLMTAIDPDVPAVIGDHTRFGQVILNLLLNAAQAIPVGRADQNEVSVTAGASADGTVLHIAVSDTGVGIPASVLPRIFDPFFTTKPPGVGTGLGLAISHQIVSSMNGEITVESEPGKGTTFHVTLPAASMAAAATTAAKRGGKSLGRILLIDDEVALGRALSAMLSPDTEVVAVTRARDALARLDGGERYDAILCDLQMPEISGIELYETVVSRAPDLAGRIVFMTGGAFTPEARDFLRRIDRPHLNKPFTEEQLRTLIESVTQDGSAAGA